MATNQSTIELELVGIDQDGLVYFSDFRSFCATVADCLRRSESIITGDNGNMAFRLSQLAIGSAKIAIEPVRAGNTDGPDKRKQVIGFFKRTVAAIENGKKVDARLGIEDLRVFKKLAKPLRRHTKSVSVNGIQISKAFEQNATRILNDTVPTDGSVSGRLDKLNVHERNEFVLFPPIPGYSIVCRFEDGLLCRVREAIKQTVTVVGKMHYAPGSPFPRLVNVRSMEIHPYDDQLPTLQDLRGAGKGCTGELTAVAFVRSLRDD